MIYMYNNNNYYYHDSRRVRREIEPLIMRKAQPI